MGVAEWTLGQIGAPVCREEPCDAVNLGDLENFFFSQRREDGGNGGCENGLPCPGRTFKEQVVPSGSRDFQRAFRHCLPPDIFEVNRICRGRGLGEFRPGEYCQFFSPAYVLAHFLQALRFAHGNAVYNRGFCSVPPRQDHAGEARAFGRKRCGEHSGYAAQTPVQAELSEKKRV